MTALALPLKVIAPVLLPSLARLGSASVPLLVALGVTVTVSVGLPALMSVMVTPANGTTVARPVLV